MRSSAFTTTPEFYVVINLVAHVNKSVPGNFFLLPDTPFYCSIAISKLQYFTAKCDTSFLNFLFLFLFFCSVRIYKAVENFESVVAEYALCNQKIFTMHDRYRNLEYSVEECVDVMKVYIAVAHDA